MKKGASQILFSVFGLAMLGAGCDLPELPPEPTPQPVQTGEPETILRGTPDVETTERSASFEFTCDAVDGCRYECRLDDQAYFACESPAVFEDLSYGEHQFFVRAIDAQNRTDTTPAVFTWLVTKNGAGSRIDSLETAPQEFNQVTVEFGCGVSSCSFECQLDDEALFPCESPLTLQRVLSGAHRFKVQAKDLSGVAVPDSDAVDFFIEDYWMHVATKSVHTCALKTDGRIFCWGLNYSRQLGREDNVIETQPVLVGDRNDWNMVRTGGRHSCALDVAGALWCWGSNQDGNLATSDDPETLEKCENNVAGNVTCTSAAPLAVAPEKTWSSISVGWQHTCGIDDEGHLYCWGKNTDGQTGNTNLINQTEPYLVSEDQWLAVAAGLNATCGLKEDSSLHCWGSWHQAHLQSVVEAVGNDTDWLTIAAGGAYDVNAFCAIKNDASLWCFGDNHEGLLGLGENPLETDTPNRLTQIDKAISVSVGGSHACSVNDDNQLWCWGQNDQGQIGNNLVVGPSAQFEPQLFDERQNWSQVTAGIAHNCALTVEGKLFCWGRNHYGATGTSESAQLVTGWEILDVPELSWNAVAAAGASSCALKVDRSLWCWGENGETPLGNTSNFHLQTPAQVGVFQWESLSAGERHACGIQGDRSLHCWGQNDAKQVSSSDQDVLIAPHLVSDARWNAVSVGTDHACGIHEDGSIFCWGKNNAGQTGQAAGETTESPQTIVHEPIFDQVSSGANHTCAIDAQKALYCWGKNDVGQLGIAHTVTEQTHLPQQVVADSVTAFQDVAVGHDHACAIDEEHGLWCWGKNDRGQCGVDAEENSMVSPIRVGNLNSWQTVAAGKNITCAIREGGSLFCWGAVVFDSSLPELILNASTPVLIDSNRTYTQVTVGEGFIMALDSEGMRYGRGQNQYGQLGNGQAWTFLPTAIQTD